MFCLGGVVNSHPAVGGPVCEGRMGKNDSLGDRMKKYEAVYRPLLTPRSCVIIRVDGQHFSSYTKGCDRPFDSRIVGGMQYAASKVAHEIAGFKLAYIQSDEASFLMTDFDTNDTQGWFDYNLSKLITIAASHMTANFNQFVQTMASRPITNKLATFDARAFVVPQMDVANYFLWRAKDWERNSLSMYAQSHFSHKELMGKKRADKHEMLHGKGKNWATDLDDQLRNGTFIARGGPCGDGVMCPIFTVKPTYAEVSQLVDSVMPKQSVVEIEEPKTEVKKSRAIPRRRKCSCR